MALINKYEGQTVFDLLLTHAGAISGLFEFLSENNLTQLDIPEGQYIAPTMINENVSSYFLSQEVVSVATGSQSIAHGAPVVLTLNGAPLGEYFVGQTNNISLVDQNNDEIIPLSILNDVVRVNVPNSNPRTTSPLMKTGDPSDGNVGRIGDFFTLGENSVFGNTDRFKDRFGTDVYADTIVIDLSTYDDATQEALGYQTNTMLNGTYKPLADAVAFCDSFVLGGVSGWRQANKNELLSILFPNSTPLYYAPFNYTGANYFWASTKFNTTLAWRYRTDTGQILPTDINTNSARPMPVRTFTFNGNEFI